MKDKRNKIDELLAKLTKSKREKTQLIKLEMKKEKSLQTSQKSNRSLGTMLKTYTPISWKIQKNFQMNMIFQNSINQENLEN